MNASRRIPRWQQTPVGGHDIRVACWVELPKAAAEQYLMRARVALKQAGFHADQQNTAPAGVVVLRRGQLLGDIMLDGTGIGRLFQRVGRLTYRAVVVLEQTNETAIISLINGAPVAREFAHAIDTVIDELAATGVRLEGEGWVRAVDLPITSVGNPHTAATYGIR